MYTGEAVDVFDLREKTSVKGSMYYFDEWHDVHIRFANGKSLSGYKGRYDLQFKSLELKRQNEIVEVPSSLIDEFLIEREDPGAINGIDTLRFVKISDGDLQSLGFVEVLESGPISLLRGVELEVLPANYVTTHDAGNTGSKYVQKEVLIIASEDRIDRLSSKKKESAKILEEYQEKSKDYILDQKVNFKNQDEVTELIIHLNNV